MESYKTTANCNPDKEDKPTGSIEKSVLDWKLQGARRRGRPKKT
jgi:hypothetical protein